MSINSFLFLLAFLPAVAVVVHVLRARRGPGAAQGALLVASLACLHAGTVVKLGFRDGLAEAEAIDLVLRALYEAADEDSATGGPDLLRGIFPVVATISSAGFERVADDVLRERYTVLYEALERDHGSVGGGTSGGGDDS